MSAWLWLYNLLFPIVLLLMLPGLTARMLRRGHYRHKFAQRFGLYSRRVREKLQAGGWIWIHAVSVGEMFIALKFLAALRERMPDARVVLSTTTSTGYRLASRHRSATLEPIYHPLDFPWCIRKAFALIRPRALVMVEAEVWPNAVALARQAGIPRVLLNARLSPRSEKRYRMARPLTASLFNSLSAILLQQPSDAARWQALGAAREKLHVTGSVKFDHAGVRHAAPRDFWPLLETFGVARTDPILLGGSTFPGEEEMLAAIAHDLRSEFPRLFLILVPRHAERAAHVLETLRGHAACLRSKPPPPRRPDILIINTTGELADWYRCSTVVFVGKSLSATARGGQNPIEPLVAGKPILFGPAMDNFQPLARQLVEAGAAVEVRDAPGLRQAAARLLADPAAREKAVQAGMACIEGHQGAARRCAEIVAALLERRSA